jgi:hypothetical protein
MLCHTPVLGGPTKYNLDNFPMQSFSRLGFDAPVLSVRLNPCTDIADNYVRARRTNLAPTPLVRLGTSLQIATGLPRLNAHGAMVYYNTADL